MHKQSLAQHVPGKTVPLATVHSYNAFTVMKDFGSNFDFSTFETLISTWIDTVYIWTLKHGRAGEKEKNPWMFTEWFS
jgi:hypothetical protein